MMAGELARQIGARIRQRREELHLNQGQLAARFDSGAINNQRISDWERGVHKPSERYMEKLAEILERDISWFYEADRPAGTPDLLGALSPADATQLDRIEAKLDYLLQEVGGVDPADFTEVITRGFENSGTQAELPEESEPFESRSSGEAAADTARPSDAKPGSRRARSPRTRRSA